MPERQAKGPKTNTEIRQWYLDQVASIPNLNKDWKKRGLPARQRARMAWSIRHNARMIARSMMTNSREVELLRNRDMIKYGNPDGPTFEFLVERLKRGGLIGEKIYEAIVDNSYRTDAELNRRLEL